MGAPAPFFMKKLLDYDPLHKVSCYFHSDGEKFHFSYEQDPTILLEANKEAANDTDKTKRGIKNEYWLYARIPAIVELEWLHKYGVSLDNKNHRKKIFQLLNDPDYRYLKTTAGHHE
jgi:hypothetical protein